MSVIIEGSVSGFPTATGGTPESIPYRTSTVPRQETVTGLSVAQGIAVFPETLIADKSGEFTENWGSGNGVIAGGQWSDFWLRLWVIPPVMQLTNPQLNSDIPFVIWNTWTSPQALTSLVVDGSSVLSFDLNPTDVINDSEIIERNLQIGAGEPTIEAEITFNYPEVQGTLILLAAISSTFNLIPEIPVTERWNFLTDVITAYDGSEQRASLRRYPRIDQEFKVENITEAQRREQYNLLTKNITIQALIPMYQYSTPVTGPTAVGENKIFFDPSRSNVRAGQFMAIVNTATGQSSLSVVASLEVDGAILTLTAGDPISGTTWIVMPALTCYIKDGSGITMNNVTGTLSIRAKSLEEPELLRPGATRTIDMLGSIPLLNRRPLISANENFRFEREIIDNKTGQRDMNSSHLHPRISGDRTFIIQRVADPDEMDYYRSLFETVQGSHGTFLLSTNLSDLTLSEPQVVSDGASQFIVNESDYENLFYVHNTWKHIEVFYGDAQKVTARKSQHEVTSVTSNPDGTATLGFTPPMPSGPEYEGLISRISFLMRCRATDTIAWRHYANYSEVSFGILSTDN
tara:strand:+ start:19959 stop:21683 length:1725 start_codon:yes stop_codon:yes gene_type:complete